MNSSVTQFSIYKIDVEKVLDVFFENNRDATIDEMLEALLNSVAKILREKSNCESHTRVKLTGFNGFVFKTIHEPDWKSVLSQIIDNNELESSNNLPDDFFTNANVSYVLFYLCDESIYVMTGGYGSFYINKFIAKSYGLYLLPKILTKDNPVVKHISENNLTGNRFSTDRTNRSPTSLISEQDLSTIYNELNIEIDKGIATKIGIQFEEDESDKKKINLINKDSLVIRRSMSLSDLSNVLLRLSGLEQEPDNFALNYLVLAQKKGIKKADLLNKLIESFKNKDYDHFILVGEGYRNYYLNFDSYSVVNQDGEIFLDSTSPITLDDIFSEVTEQDIRLTKHFIKHLLKSWQIVTRDRSGNQEQYSQNMLNALQGFIEYGSKNAPYYLINGEWYVFDEVYSGLLNKEYHELFMLKINQSSQIKASFNLDKPAANETKYNKDLGNDKRIIVTHTALYNNVEIADAIYWDDSTLYLMHNKNDFNGIGARDLLNQMLTAAECLQSNRMISGSEFLSKYYRSICGMKKIKKLPQVSEAEFINLFSGKRICFIAGFLNGYKKNSKSTYAKYLTIEAYKKLSNMGYDFIPLGIH